MPQDAAIVQKKLEDLQVQNLRNVSKEIAALPELLYADEDIQAITNGLVKDKIHFLVVTNKRILMLYIGMIGGLKTLELPLSQVKSISYSAGLLMGKLLIDTGGQTQKLKNSPKANAQAVANAVSRLLNTPQESTAPQISRLTDEAPAKKAGLNTWTKKKAFVAVGIFIIVWAFIASFENKGTAQQAPAQQSTQPASPAVEHAAGSSIKGTPLTYTVLTRDEEVRASIKRNRLRLTIIPTQDQSAATQADLAATVASVAMQEQQKSGIPVVIVTMLCQQAANAYGELQLANAVYIPDGKGFDGKTAKPVWETLSAAPRGFTPQEREYLRLWAEMREKFQKNGMTDEQALKAAISKRMGSAVESIKPHVNVLKSLETKVDIAVPAQEKALVKQNAEIKKDKEFSQDRFDIAMAYDDVMEQLGGGRPIQKVKAKKIQAKHYDGFSYTLTPNTGLVFLMNKGGLKPYAVKAIAVEDGTEQTRTFIVLNCIGLIAAVTPDWTGDERGDVAEALGISTAFPPRGATKSLSHGGKDFLFANNGEQGLTLTIEPTALESKQPRKQ